MDFPKDEKSNSSQTIQLIKIYNLTVSQENLVTVKTWTLENAENLKDLTHNKSGKDKYLVTAPIERPQRPIRDIFLLLLKYDTTTLRSSLWHMKQIYKLCMQEVK